jgi:hypothetical protein
MQHGGPLAIAIDNCEPLERDQLIEGVMSCHIREATTILNKQKEKGSRQRD